MRSICKCIDHQRLLSDYKSEMGDGHGIYFAKDQQITIGTYLYSGKQTDEQSDTILRILKEICGETPTHLVNVS